MEKTIKKHTKRLAILKENRARTVDTNTDAENELYGQLIKQVAEFIRDIKQLNIADVTQCFKIGDEKVEIASLKLREKFGSKNPLQDIYSFDLEIQKILINLLNS